MRPAYFTAIYEGDLGDNGEIVGHIDQGDASLAAKPPDLIDDVGLGHNVEASRWLIQDHHRRLADDCDGDRHPLLLAAGDLMREALSEYFVRRQMNLSECLQSFPAIRPAMLPQHHLDRIADPPGRVESLTGILRYVGDRSTSLPADALLRLGEQIFAAEQHLSAGDTNPRSCVTEQCESRSRLATAHSPTMPSTSPASRVIATSSTTSSPESNPILRLVAEGLGRLGSSLLDEPRTRRQTSAIWASEA